MAIVDKKLIDDVLHQSLNIFRFKAAKQTEIAKRLKALEKQLIKELSGPLLSDSRRDDINKFLKNSGGIIAEHYEKASSGLELNKLSETVAGNTSKSLKIFLGDEAPKIPSSMYFKSVMSDVLIKGHAVKDWWSEQSRQTAFKFAGEVRQGLANAETNQQIIARIVGTKAVPGIMPIARNNAAALVQTSVMAVANDARLSTFQANSDIIKGLQVVATLDGHTCVICMGYSGAEYELDGTPLNDAPALNGGPPWHFNDRCVLVPITKTFKELGLDIPESEFTTRASDLGQVDSKTTFDDFLQRKGKAYQDEMLGEGRADLWRDGKITTRDLIDGKGRPLTLNQLQEKFDTDFSGAEFMKSKDNPNVTAQDIISSFSNASERLEEFKEKLKDLPETKSTYFVNGNYTKDREKIHEQILFKGITGIDQTTGKNKYFPPLLGDEALKKASPEGFKPTLTVLGGRGGSGKTAFNGEQFEDVKVYDKDKTLLLDADAIKAMLPEYKGFNAFQVHEESSDILQKAIDFAREARINLVIDGTLKTDQPTLERIAAFKAQGYRVEAHYMYLSREEAAKRAVSRALGKTARYVPPEVVLGNKANEATFDKVRKVVDNWSFWRNDVEKGKAPVLVSKKGK